MGKPRTAADPAAYVRLALPLMAKYKVPITPSNYAVWYSYVSGENRELRSEIDGIISEHGVFSSKTNQQLSQRFGLGNGYTEVGRIRSQLRQTHR